MHGPASLRAGGAGIRVATDLDEIQYSDGKIHHTFNNQWLQLSLWPQGCTSTLQLQQMKGTIRQPNSTLTQRTEVVLVLSPPWHILLSHGIHQLFQNYFGLCV